MEERNQLEVGEGAVGTGGDFRELQATDKATTPFQQVSTFLFLSDSISPKYGSKMLTTD